MKRTVVLLLLGLLALAACGRPPTPPPSPSPGSEPLQVVAVAAVSDLAVGPNRFSFALFHPDGSEIRGATAQVAFFRIEGNTGQVKASAAAAYQEIPIETPHVHENSQVHIHHDVRGVYAVPRVALDPAGLWGAIVEATSAQGSSLTATLTFQVKDHSSTPALGAPVPASITPTGRTDAELRAISTREPPAPELYRVSVQQALAAHRPFVVAFGTPSFCQTALCGPVVEIVLSVVPQYRDRVDFIHVEPYDLGLARGQGRLVLTSVSEEWGLPSEPWVFVVDAQGRLAAKFEGIMGKEELDQALKAMLAAG